MQRLPGGSTTLGRSRNRWIAAGIAVAVIVLVSIGIGYKIGSKEEMSQMPGESEQIGEGSPEALEWTCSMHPQIRQPKPGRCPICGMDLIPVEGSEGGEDAGPSELTLSPKARRLAEVQTAVAERKFVTAEVRMVGKVDYDETRVSYITAWTPGRLDKLFVNYTGVRVQKGDHMVHIYSPELIAAQEELIQAVATAEQLKDSDVKSIRQTANDMVEVTREKLRLLGLTPQQISEIESRGTASDHITIYAPTSGVVVHKNALEGEYVKTGTRIYTIADLSQVWVMLDAYESDLQWIRLGQEVEFHAEAYPSDVFKGKVAFIDPILDSKTRTAKVRVNLPNPEGKLKPGMFVHAVLKADVEPHNGDGTPLVIPASAPLITGKRAVVYVETEPGHYEGREIELGARVGDYYVVEKGLEDGERVVTQGNFKIDSAIQILAKPSMMSPEGDVLGGHAQEGSPAGEEQTGGESLSITRYMAPRAFQSQIGSVYAAYLEIHDALSGDAFEDARDAARGLEKALDGVDARLLDQPAQAAWAEDLECLARTASDISGAVDISVARASFKPLSESMYTAVKQFGTTGDVSIYRYYCSMAFDNLGGYWLQDAGQLENPYYGAMMLRCGELTETIVAAGDAPETGEGQHHD